MFFYDLPIQFRGVRSVILLLFDLRGVEQILCCRRSRRAAGAGRRQTFFA
jgi:hypothetical protein